MPSTSTSSPPLLVLVTRASTISPLRRFSQFASTAAPLSERIRGPRRGRTGRRRPRSCRPGWADSSSNCSTGMTPSLLAPRSTKTLLPRMPMTFPFCMPAPSSWPRFALGTCSRSAARVRGSCSTSKVDGSKPAIAASSSASRSASHWRFKGGSCDGACDLRQRPLPGRRRSPRRGLGLGSRKMVSRRPWESHPSIELASVTTILVSVRIAQFQGRPEARVLADGELAADAEELVLAVGVGR